MVNQHFVEPELVQIYSDHRPDIPPEIAERSVNFLREKFYGELDTAVDIGCGSGQGTVILAPYFRHVYGLDASETQIQEALRKRSRPNIHYKVQSAENMPFETCSVQLATASASMHWFDLEVFFSEVRRILVPQGVLVAYTYHSLRPFTDSPIKKKEVDALYEQIYEELFPYWPKEVHSSLDKYEKVHFPFEECRRSNDTRQFLMGSFSDLIGFVESFSAFQLMKKADFSKAESFLKQFDLRLRDIMEVPDKQSRTMKLYRDFYSVMCRKE